jgi:hypothetical protein
MTCKLQEFPVLFIYLHTLALPLALALQMAVGRWCGGGGGSSNGTRHRTTAVKALDEAKAARRILRNSGQRLIRKSWRFGLNIVISVSPTITIKCSFLLGPGQKRKSIQQCLQNAIGKLTADQFHLPQPRPIGCAPHSRLFSLSPAWAWLFCSQPLTKNRPRAS